MRLKRNILVTALSAALTTSTVGCLAIHNSQKSDPSSFTTINVWTYYNGSQLTSFNDLVDQFNTTRGAELGIVVRSQSHGSINDLESHILASAQGKVGAEPVPEIFAAYADTAYAVDQMGLVVDIASYFTEKELETYVDSYIEEGRLRNDETLQILPTAKSLEVMLINQTDWEPFSRATGASYKDLSTIEGVTATAQSYYEWTDSLTPKPNDGKAFFGRDAMANYFFIGAMQQGVELLSVKNKKASLHFNENVIRKLWDNYYVPYVKGYFDTSGRFRSDDVKTGNIIAFVGSTSGATFFPDRVILSDTESYPIEVKVLPAPMFATKNPYAVQQGAGMVVTNTSPKKIKASMEFLKWFTQEEQNTSFSIRSGYLPVKKASNNLESCIQNSDSLSGLHLHVLETALETANSTPLYTPHAFDNGTKFRSILEYSMSDLAKADRAVVKQRLASGSSLEDACAQFVSDAYFQLWYKETLAQLEALL